MGDGRGAAKLFALLASSVYCTAAAVHPVENEHALVVRLTITAAIFTFNTPCALHLGDGRRDIVVSALHAVTSGGDRLRGSRGLASHFSFVTVASPALEDSQTIDVETVDEPVVVIIGPIVTELPSRL